MKTFHYGSTRIVVLLPLVGIVLKFPMPRFERWFRDFRWSIKKKNWKLARFYLTGPTKNFLSLRGCLLRSIMVNWNEYQFYRKNKHPFLCPTFFSVFGLVNIQKLEKNCGYGHLDLWKLLGEILGQDLYEDTHTFNNAENFSVSKQGGLHLRDYASPGAQLVVMKHGMRLSELNGSPSR